MARDQANYSLNPDISLNPKFLLSKKKFEVKTDLLNLDD